MDECASLVGRLLLAMPGIGDPRFDRAVIMVCAHDEGGALGIGIGRLAARVGFHDLLEQFEIPVGVAPNRPVHLGGPVDPQRGFVLHELGWEGEDTIEVDGGWALTGTIDVLRAIAEGTGPRKWIAALGYAGWSAGQLDRELTRHGWFVAPATDALLFEAQVDTRWRQAFQAAGVDSRMLVSGAGAA